MFSNKLKWFISRKDWKLFFYRRCLFGQISAWMFLTCSFLYTGFYFIFHFNYKFSSISIKNVYILKPWTDSPGIKSRFDQRTTGHKISTNLENLLPKTASGDDFSNDWLLSVCNFYGSDINRELLETQLTILKRHAQASSIASVSSIINFLNATICFTQWDCNSSETDIRSTQRLFFVKYLFGEAKTTSNFLLLEDR